MIKLFTFILICFSTCSLNSILTAFNKRLICHYPYFHEKGFFTLHQGLIKTHQIVSGISYNRIDNGEREVLGNFVTLSKKDIRADTIS